MTKLIVKGYRVLVDPDKLETETESGIVIVQDERVEKSKLQTGTVIGLGDTCWRGESFDEPWCKLGDKIMFSQHAGRFVKIGEDQLMIMNDTDVLGVLEGEEE